MKRDLETLKNQLWEVFESAVNRHRGYDDDDDTSSHRPNNLNIQNKQAIGVLAQAIVVTEKEIREQKEQAAATTPRTIDKRPSTGTNI